MFASIAVAYVLFVGAMYVFQRNLMYFPASERPHPAQTVTPDMRPVTTKTADGLDLVSWYQPARAGHATLVYFHGNAGHIGDRAFKVRPYVEAGYGVLIVGYRGYGGNPGSPTEEGLYQDGRAVLEFLVRQSVTPGDTVLYGESLGSGVAVHLASESPAPFAAVVLEAPFTSAADVAASHYPFVPAQWLTRDRFDSASKIKAVRAPVFIFHGERDRTVPVRFGRELFAAAVEPKEGHWIGRGFHNDLYDHGGADAVIEYLRRIVPADGPLRRPAGQN